MKRNLTVWVHLLILRRKNTPAATFDHQVEESVKEDWQADVMELQEEIILDKNESMIGKEILVMIEGKVADENAYVGRSYRDAPDIDGLVFVNTDTELVSGDFVKVVLPVPMNMISSEN